MFIFDTNVVSELRRPEKAHKKVRAFSDATPIANVFLSTITLLELEFGALKIERRDKDQGKVLRTWIEDYILPQFKGRILSIDTAVARACARLHIPNPRAERDAFIAATAIVHGMTVATRNVADFAGTGAKLLNPWGD
jgi:predicted nucleic acid-binding protein